MKQRLTILVVMLSLAAAGPAAADLMISEYVEGSSFNKAVEIYNPDGAAINTDGYALEVYFNGNATVGTTIDLSGFVIAPGDVIVVADDGADPAILAVTDLTTTSSLWNGDDAVALVGTSGTLDVIGQIGLDPGSEWGAGDQSTQNNTIRRNSDVCAGDPDGTDAFDPAAEWAGFPTDTFDGLGTHTANCGSVPVTADTWGQVKGRYR